MLAVNLLSRNVGVCRLKSDTFERSLIDPKRKTINHHLSSHPDLVSAGTTSFQEQEAEH